MKADTVFLLSKVIKAKLTEQWVIQREMAKGVLLHLIPVKTYVSETQALHRTL